MAFNTPSLEKFESKLRTDGLLFYDSSLINDKPKRKDITILPIPATKLADELGSTKVTNIVMLGAYLGYTHLLPLESFYQVLPKLIKREKLIETNIKAIQRGAEYVQKEMTQSGRFE
jgi:Pyruvate/2-oxoacid:ferredoxin oxidoreductase gamma subunit